MLAPHPWDDLPLLEAAQHNATPARRDIFSNMSSTAAGAGAPEKDVEHVEVAAQPQPAKVEETAAPTVAHVTVEVDEDVDDVPDPDEDDLDDLDGKFRATHSRWVGEETDD